MLRLELIAASNRQPGWVDAGYAEYADRLRGRCTLELKVLPLARRTASTPPDRALADEGARMARADPFWRARGRARGSRQAAVDERPGGEARALVASAVRRSRSCSAAQTGSGPRHSAAPRSAGRCRLSRCRTGSRASSSPRRSTEPGRFYRITPTTAPNPGRRRASPRVSRGRRPRAAAGLGGFAATSYSLLNEKGFRLPRLGFAAAKRAAASDRRAVRGASRANHRGAGERRSARRVRAAARSGEGGRRLAASSGRGAQARARRGHRRRARRARARQARRRGRSRGDARGAVRPHASRADRSRAALRRHAPRRSLCEQRSEISRHDGRGACRVLSQRRAVRQGGWLWNPRAGGDVRRASSGQLFRRRRPAAVRDGGPARALRRSSVAGARLGARTAAHAGSGAR